MRTPEQPHDRRPGQPHHPSARLASGPSPAQRSEQPRRSMAREQNPARTHASHKTALTGITRPARMPARPRPMPQPPQLEGGSSAVALARGCDAALPTFQSACGPIPTVCGSPLHRPGGQRHADSRSVRRGRPWRPAGVERGIHGTGDVAGDRRDPCGFRIPVSGSRTSPYGGTSIRTASGEPRRSWRPALRSASGASSSPLGRSPSGDGTSMTCGIIVHPSGLRLSRAIRSARCRRTHPRVRGCQGGSGRLRDA